MEGIEESFNGKEKTNLCIGNHLSSINQADASCKENSMSFSIYINTFIIRGVNNSTNPIRAGVATCIIAIIYS